MYWQHCWLPPFRAPVRGFDFPYIAHLPFRGSVAAADAAADGGGVDGDGVKGARWMSFRSHDAHGDGIAVGTGQPPVPDADELPGRLMSAP